MQPDQPRQPASGAPRPHAQPPAGSSGNPRADEVLYEGVRQHAASLGGYLKWAMVTLAAGAAGYFGTRIAGLGEYPLYLLALIGLPGLLWTYLRHRTTKFKITTRRVEFERGVVAKDVDSLELWRVLDVRYNQSVLDRILGLAKITLVTTDQSHPDLPLHGLPRHRQLFEQLRDAVQAARHTHRPMELVGQDGGTLDLEHIGHHS